MALQLPTVTIVRKTCPSRFLANKDSQDDLRLFHAAHFPNAPLPESYLHGTPAEPAEEEHVYEDEGLGYYSDGVERTLTDEQIAMFRHTEIQTILRERRRRREEGKPLHETPAPPSPPNMHDVTDNGEPGDPTSPAPEQSTSPSTRSGPDKVQNGRVEKSKYQWTAVSEKSRARNAKNRNKNRANHRAKKKEERKRKEMEEREAEESDEWDPWHQANGPDAQKDTTVDLDY
jgi:hypothetical protein